jgi:hypothetical protein
MALEQKLPCGGTVLPFHSNTRARTDLIFMRGFTVKEKKEEENSRIAAPTHALGNGNAFSVAFTSALPWPAMSYAVPCAGVVIGHRQAALHRHAAC